MVGRLPRRPRGGVEPGPPRRPREAQRQTGLGGIDADSAAG